MIGQPLFVVGDRETADGWYLVIETDQGKVTLDGDQEHELYLALCERESEQP